MTIRSQVSYSLEGRTARFAVLLLGLLTVLSPLIGQSKPPSGQEARSSAHEYFTDVVLTNHLGRKKRLYSDILASKIVVVNSFFTTCDGACPRLNSTFLEVQKWLGDRMGKEVHLVSLSVDPENDTSETLRAYAERIGAKPGWEFFTGKKENLDWALHRLGFYVEQRENHSNIFIVGNESTGLWQKVKGLSDVKHTLEAIQTAIDDHDAPL